MRAVKAPDDRLLTWNERDKERANLGIWSWDLDHDRLFVGSWVLDLLRKYFLFRYTPLELPAR